MLRSTVLRNTALCRRGRCAVKTGRGGVVYFRRVQFVPAGQGVPGRAGAAPQVLALAYHVDYWDDLGWHDRFGLPQAVQRQRAYARALGLSTVYTPQTVIDGQENFIGSDRRSIARALEGQRRGVSIALSARGGEVVVDFRERANVAPSDVVLVAYQRSAISRIGRGENAGRTLRDTTSCGAYGTSEGGRGEGEVSLLGELIAARGHRCGGHRAAARSSADHRGGDSRASLCTGPTPWSIRTCAWP